MTSVANFFVAQSGTLCALYFKFMSKNWYPFEILGLIMAGISLFSMIFIPESPRWLIAKGHYKEALKVYKKIARVNGKVFTQMLYKLSRNSASKEVFSNLANDPNNWVARGGTLQEMIQ